MPRLLALLAALMLLPAAGASAAASLTADPDRPSSGTHLHLVADGSEFAGKVPSALTLRLARGFTVDPGAVAGRCENPDACPADSRIGGGIAIVEATTPFGLTEVAANISIFLASAVQREHIAGVVAVVEVQGDRTSAVGHIVGVSGSPFGLEVRFDSFPSPKLPPGVTLRLKRLELEAGAERVDRVRSRCRKRSRTCRPARRGCRGKRCKLYKTRSVQRNLLFTPSSCAGSWPAQAEARFADGSSAIVDAPAGCRAAA